MLRERRTQTFCSQTPSPPPFPFPEIKVLSHEATCRSDMSLQENHVSHGATRPCDMSPGSAVAGKAHDWFIYRLVAVTCCKYMSHKGTERVCDILSPQRHMNSN